MKASYLSVIAIAGACVTGCRSVSELRPPSKFPYADDISFRGFAEEALYGHGTQRTHLFDDYTKGSYHVYPREVAEGLFKVAPQYRLDLQAVVVVGPYGPLWAYDVIAIVRTAECARVNWLLMPHARITVKRSGCVPPAAVSAFLEDLSLIAASDSSAAEEDSCVVLSQAGELRWSRFACYTTDSPPEFERLEHALELLMKGLEVTYSGYPPVEESDDP